jgi:hypothetical protein
MTPRTSRGRLFAACCTLAATGATSPRYFRDGVKRHLGPDCQLTSARKASSEVRHVCGTA